jgi:hypothetical protein
MKRSMTWSCLSLVLFAVGCGPAGRQFHGEYSGTDMINVAITGRGNETRSVTVSYWIAEGVDSDIVFTESSGGCALPASVEGDVATLRAGVSCSATMPTGETVSLTFTGGTALLSGTLVQLNVSGTLVVSGNGQSYPGTFARIATLARIAK